jgi:hypothetical protein
MEAAYILTGYNNLTLSLVNPPTSEEDAPNILSTLLDQFIDTTQCQYDDPIKKIDNPDQIIDTTQCQYDDDPIKKIDNPPIGLQGSHLLCQLPWLTPWAKMFQTLEPVTVEF